jgi:hypothetical protein
MARLLTQMAAILLALAANPTDAADAPPDRYRLRTGVDLSYVDASGHPSWTEGSIGKLRYDDNNEGLMISRAFADYEFQLADTFKFHAAVEAYDDDAGAAVDFTEAYVEWRPVPRSANRYRFKLGAFYPRISLENVSAGWSSPYTLNPSAINTWVGEEIRTLGAEMSVSRRPEMFGGLHTFSLQGAVFLGNDLTGGLLAWKGWSVHDRQTRFGDELPLAPLPQFQPGMLFERQEPYVEPFMEVDDEPGFYVNAEWAVANRFLLRVMHYDNRTDPLAYATGQIGWKTEFDHVGLQAILPGNIDVIVQWMGGYTVWGPILNGTHVVDADFYSDFILLSKSFRRHRLSLRYERFEVIDNDQIPLDDNSEYGHAWTLAYRLQASERASLAVEALEIFSYRDAWTYFGFDDEETETQLQIGLQLRFGN